MEYVVFGVAVLVILAILFVKGIIDEKVNARKFKEDLKKNYGQLPKREYRPEQYANIAHYFYKHKDKFSIDDITWNDLNMDEVFMGMNHTYSSAGEEYLYYMLRTPQQDTESFEKEENAIHFFEQEEEKRVTFQCIFNKLGRIGKFSMYDYLEYLDELGERTNQPHYIAIAGIFIAIIAFFWSVPMGIILLLGILIYNLMTYFRIKKEIEPYITSFAYIFKVLNCVKELEKNEVPVFQDEMAELHECMQKMKNFGHGAYLLMSPTRMSASSNPLEIILDYLRMTFHLDLIQFNHMLAEVRKHIDEIDKTLTLIGYMEATIAIGAYRKSLNYYCIPQFANGAGYQCEEEYHPLINNPVVNSIQTTKSVLLTGSNASGKSTFLKTVAINAILAQTIHTSLSRSYQADLFRICSSMSLRDDVMGGDSYYMVEIKSLKRILNEYANEGNPILCFVDEVLRGTNTVERIAASTQILKSLNAGNNICFAATHDIELTQLLEEEYNNYHFEEEILDNDVHFNYKLLEGRASTRNAIKLLQVMGYSSVIVKTAERQAENFIATGNWNKI